MLTMSLLAADDTEETSTDDSPAHPTIRVHEPPATLRRGSRDQIRRSIVHELKHRCMSALCVASTSCPAVEDAAHDDEHHPASTHIIVVQSRSNSDNTRFGGDDDDDDASSTDPAPLLPANKLGEELLTAFQRSPTNIDRRSRNIAAAHPSAEQYAACVRMLL
jgi:hypothetical protein